MPVPVCFIVLCLHLPEMVSPCPCGTFLLHLIWAWDLEAFLLLCVGGPYLGAIIGVELRTDIVFLKPHGCCVSSEVAEFGLVLNLSWESLKFHVNKSFNFTEWGEGKKRKKHVSLKCCVRLATGGVCPSAYLSLPHHS